MTSPAAVILYMIFFVYIILKVLRIVAYFRTDKERQCRIEQKLDQLLRKATP